MYIYICMVYLGPEHASPLLCEGRNRKTPSPKAWKPRVQKSKSQILNRTFFWRMREEANPTLEGPLLSGKGHSRPWDS